MNENNNFSDQVREKRQRDFIKPYELAYKSYLDLRLHIKENEYFFKNASLMIENMRIECWENFLVAEEEFSKTVCKSLYKKDDDVDLTNKQAIYRFIDDHVNDFYTLSLSNTQSRRSRAGTEFEAIIELLFIGAGLLFDSQGFLSSGIFEEHNLGKAVDLVSPGVIEYGMLKRNCSLISCKTSLRERWAEVIEEKERTGASEIYLATLDKKISANTLKILNDKNVIPVVTKSIKEESYFEFRNVITFEELLEIIHNKNLNWSCTGYSPEHLSERVSLIENQMKKHIQLNHEYIRKFYYNKKSDLLNLPENE